MPARTPRLPARCAQHPPACPQGPQPCEGEQANPGKGKPHAIPHFRKDSNWVRGRIAVKPRVIHEIPNNEPSAIKHSEDESRDRQPDLNGAFDSFAGENSPDTRACEICGEAAPGSFPANAIRTRPQRGLHKRKQSSRWRMEGSAAAQVCSDKQVACSGGPPRQEVRTTC